MDCDLCPIVVHKALAGVEGVTAVQVEYRRERATVTYDDEKTSTAALIEVLTNVGYPARVVP